MIDISKSESIQGWMSHAELTWLAQQASNHDLIIEVGSFLGRSTRALGDHAKGKVIAIDTWTGPVGANEREELPSFFGQFQDNLFDLIVTEKVIPYKSTDVLAFREVNFVFIDADHQYAGVKKDIEYWLPRVAKGGIISGHDYSYPDVRRAVNESLKVVIQPLGTDIWYSHV
jgi:predicted O-methyltransferase YrrM